MMSGRCSAYAAKQLVNTYINDIQKEMNKIQKNFYDMDFENADARKEMEHIIENMKAQCRSLISELNSQRFF